MPSLLKICLFLEVIFDNRWWLPDPITASPEAPLAFFFKILDKLSKLLV
jgi:hypothetical protein